MSVNIYATAADATNQTNVISTASAYTSFTVADGSSLLGTMYTSTLSSFAVTGTDSALVSVEFNSGVGTDVKIFVNDGISANALWKNKASYSFNLVVTQGSNTATLPITAEVTASTAFTVTSGAALTVANNHRGSLSNTVTTDIGATSGLVLNYQISGGDHASFSVDAATGVLSLIEFSDQPAKGSYTLNLTVGTDHATWDSSAITSTQAVTVTVSTGTPLLVNDSNMASAAIVASVAFDSVDDGFSGALTPNKLFSSGESVFRLGGADAGSFTVSPVAGGVKSHTGSVSLTNAASFQTKSSYAFTIEASNDDGTTYSSPINCTLSVSADSTVPVISDFGVFTQNDPNDASIKFKELNSAAQVGTLGTLTVDENCTFAISNVTPASSIEISASTSTTCDLQFTGGVAPYGTHENVTYTFTVVATDTTGSSNSRTTNFKVSVVDTGAPTMMISSLVVGNGSNTFTSTTTIPFTFLVSPVAENYTTLGGAGDTSDAFSIGDITVTNGTVANFVQDGTNPKLYTADVVPGAQSGSDPLAVTVTVAGGAFTDNAGNGNVEATYEFNFDAVNDLLTFANGINATDDEIAIGQIFTPSTSDVTSSDNAAVIAFSPSEIKPVIGFQFFITYTATDSANNVRSISRQVVSKATHADYRAESVISVTGGSTYHEKGDAWSDDAVVVLTNKIDPAETVTTTVSGPGGITSVDINVLGTYTLTYSYTDPVYGEIASSSRSFHIVGKAVTFTLSALSGAMSTSSFNFSSISGAVNDTSMDTYHTIGVTMDKAEWNDLFYISPSDPGLAQLNTLANVDVFEEETFGYKTVSTNMQTAIDSISTTNLSLNVGTLTSDTASVPIADSATKVWAKSIFGGQEHMEDVFANTAAIKGEINTYLSGTDDNSLLGDLRAALASADDKTNALADRTLTNLGRQLTLQLHSAISGTNSEYRLTASAGGIFAGTPSTLGTSDNYYPFLFQHGDKLRFSLALSHPAIDNTQFFDTGSDPSTLYIRVEVTMADSA
jgi:hypothetical protein